MEEDQKVDRDYRLDVVRGVAILLMIIDHVLLILGVQIEPDGLGWVRCTLTRLACPLFFVVAGVLWFHKLPSWSRSAQLAIAAPLVTLLVSSITGPSVDILTQYLVLIGAAPAVVACPASVLVLGAIQSNWLPANAPAYEWGYLLQFLALGSMMGGLWGTLPGVPHIGWLAAVGRRPLTWYVGQWVVLAASFWLLMLVLKP